MSGCLIRIESRSPMPFFQNTHYKIITNQTSQLNQWETSKIFEIHMLQILQMYKCGKGPSENHRSFILRGVHYGPGVHTLII